MISNDKNASSALADRCGLHMVSMTPSSLAARLLEAYRTRGALLGTDLFQAPAWEILLHLETAASGLSLADLHRATDTPASTLDRWLAVLISRGLVQEDGTRALYLLTESARSRLAQVLRSALKEPPIGERAAG